MPIFHRITNTFDVYAVCCRSVYSSSHGLRCPTSTGSEQRWQAFHSGQQWSQSTYVLHLLLPLALTFYLPFLQISANSYIIDTYQRYTASAVAAKTFLRSIIGATVPLWVNQMYAGMTPQWASTLLGFLAILAMPIPFVFFYVSFEVYAQV